MRSTLTYPTNKPPLRPSEQLPLEDGVRLRSGSEVLDPFSSVAISVAANGRGVMTRIRAVRRVFPLINLILVAALVGVGIFQAVIYWRQANIMDTQADIAGKQWIAMKDQLGEMKAASQDTKDAIVGIRQLADATIKGSNKAEAFYISSLRAWVAYEDPPVPVTPLFISKTGARFDMRFHIRNVGKSVASSVKLIAELHPCGLPKLAEEQLDL
jgi:hypothetical protein